MSITQRHHSMVSPEQKAFEPKGNWTVSFPLRLFVNSATMVLFEHLRKGQQI